jgi:pimeloyl-ACP methyl ester carboxylesterase
LNLWAAWEKAEAPVLAIWGEHDWIMSREDIEKLAEIANRKRPGSGRFVSLPRTTHGIIQNDTDEYSQRNFGTGSFNQAVVPLVFEWMNSIAKKP